jgi:hypothetical protein
VQLRLTKDEIKLLVDVLQDGPAAAARRTTCTALLNRVLDRDLDFDCEELDELSDFLAETSRRLHDQLIRGEDAAIRRRQEAVQRVLDKVIEAEAMV